MLEKQKADVLKPEQDDVFAFKSNKTAKVCAYIKLYDMKTI